MVVPKTDRPGTGCHEAHLRHLGTGPERAARHAGPVYEGEMPRALSLYGEGAEYLDGQPSLFQNLPHDRLNWVLAATHPAAGQRPRRMRSICVSGNEDIAAIVLHDGDRADDEVTVEAPRQPSACPPGQPSPDTDGDSLQPSKDLNFPWGISAMAEGVTT